MLAFDFTDEDTIKQAVADYGTYPLDVLVNSGGAKWSWIQMAGTHQTRCSRLSQILARTYVGIALGVIPDHDGRMCTEIPHLCQKPYLTISPRPGMIL
jgi:hypothetical protein